MSALLFKLLAPESALVIAALAALGADIAFLRGKTQSERLSMATLIGSLGIIAAMALPLLLPVGESEFRSSAGGAAGTGNSLVNFLAHDLLSAGGELFILILGGLTLMLISATSRLRNPAEHVALTLFALTGMLLMAAANNLLVVFASLELASLSLYILAGFDKRDPRSAEAGLKYFLYGGTAAAFMLFGFSLLYGLTGEIRLDAIAAKFGLMPVTPLLIVAIVLSLIGLAYKIAAAPFHIWAPDAYQGAPTTSAALIASASKVAAFILLARFLRVFCNTGTQINGADSAIDGQWFVAFAAIVAASLLLGNIAALAQTNIRRLLAYSAIAHAGVLMLGALNEANVHLLYYAFTYGLATIGAFGVLAVLEHAGAPAQKLSDLAGLWKRSRVLGGTLLVFILSLAGIPPLAGFLAKFYIFRDTLRDTVPASPYGGALFALVILAIALTVVALYYYLQILRQAFIADPKPASENTAAPLRVSFSAALPLIAAAAGIIALGIRGCN